MKKVIIADTLSKAVSWGYGNVDAGITSMEGILMIAVLYIPDLL